MQVAAEFGRHGLSVTQGQLLPGSDPGGFVEVDVMAWRTNLVDGLANFRFFLLAECKKAHLPWVLFTSDDVFDSNQSIEFRESVTAWGAEYLRLVSGRPDIQAIPSLQVLGRPAYGLRTANLPTVKASRKEKKIRVWDKAEDAQVQLRRVIQAWWIQNKGEDDSPPWDVLVYFPAIILDGRLFEAHLGEAQEVEVREVPHGVLELPVVGEPEGIVFVDVVTRAHLSEFAADIGRAFEIMTEQSPTEQAELIRSIREAARPL